MPAFHSSRLEILRDGFDGALLAPGHAGFDEARTIFNAMIDRRPAVIAQCASNADVQAAIRFAREHELQVAVRGGAPAQVRQYPLHAWLYSKLVAK